MSLYICVIFSNQVNAFNKHVIFLLYTEIFQHVTSRAAEKKQQNTYTMECVTIFEGKKWLNVFSKQMLLFICKQ